MGTKILLADDHEIVRCGLKAIIETRPDLEVIGEAGNGREAVSMVDELRPHIVIMDITMPDLNGLEATRQIKDKHPAIRIIALSMHHNKRFVVDMLKAGVSGYISKATVHNDLLLAIGAAMAGEVYLSSKITGIVAEDYITGQAGGEAVPASVLSPREREVLQLIAEGKSTKEIALHLHVSVKTIESTRRQIMNKLNIFNVADLTKYAISEGLTTLEF